LCCAAAAPAAGASSTAGSGATAGAPAPAGGTGSSKTCTQGRFLLQCSEKDAIFGDSIDWSHLAILDFEPFEVKLPLHLSNPSLAQFLRFEACTAAARGELEFEFGSEIVDTNFESVAPIAKLPKPSVGPHGIVTGKLARTLSRLMQAEQQEVLALGALDTAMNRATAARYERGREDWVSWQEAAAARFASTAASAIGRVIPAEKAASKALVKAKLLFGVGSRDLQLAKRNVRAHGLAAKLVAIMTRLGLTPTLLAQVKHSFLTTKAINLSFSLSEELATPHLIAEQQAAATGLRHFAKRIPPAPKPPS
jgi:hypothetical protein